ncbi:hypothetical protein A0J61_04341 [Choanephora cucurbitarum]|uniref:BZIP domain-containing protein n=1 Tax=Choanephora cucurbitarum TaxID=101091 RepID=A0A1C7NET9_9FUNG|nr:hypothetical protein A0J61_04341 [Choanephora cucurbitarum]
MDNQAIRQESTSPSTSAFRPIMPSSTPPKILPRPESLKLNNDQSWIRIPSKRPMKGPNEDVIKLPGVNSTNDLRIRRKEQNRAAQRAFRERKERYVKELEDKIKEIKAAHAIQVAQLEKENQELKLALKRLQNTSPEAASTPNKKQRKRSLSPVGDISSPQFSDTQSPINASPVSTSPRTASPMRTSPINTSPTPRIPSSAVACIRDKDGISFCERLKEEVCSRAYNQLLTEPLFDSHGFLNETISSHPVPIVTTDEEGNECRKSEIFNRMEQDLTDRFLPTQHDASALHKADGFISCSEVWAKISAHPRFEEFDVDELCDEIRKRAKCSRNGPVFEEHDVIEVLETMEAKLNFIAFAC